VFKLRNPEKAEQHSDPRENRGPKLP